MVNQIIVTIITIFGSGIVSFLIAKNAAKKELEKMYLNNKLEHLTIIIDELMLLWAELKQGKTNQDRFNKIFYKFISYSSERTLKIAVKFQEANAEIAKNKPTKIEDFHNIPIFILLIKSARFDVSAEEIKNSDLVSILISADKSQNHRNITEVKMKEFEEKFNITFR